MPPPPAPPTAPNVASKPAFKRQKVRKGTFSCWECKARKVKCDLRPGSGSVCSSCHRRGVQCVSQEFVEVGEKNYQHVGRRIDHIEDLVSQLVQQRFSASSASQKTSKNWEGSLVDAVETLDRSKGSFSPSVSTTGQQMLNECCSLSAYLHSLLPSQLVTMIILRECKFFQLPFHLVRHKHEKLRSLKPTTERLHQVSKPPPPTAPPNVFAHRLIQIAICLQELDKIESQQLQSCLNGSAVDAASRFFNLASRHVTSKDELMESLEGLETLLLEAGFYINIGKPRAAWSTIRRALGIAEIIGLHSLRKTMGSRAENVWFRLHSSDRHVSFMVSLPYNSSDNGFADENVLLGKTPAERLERHHTALVGRIIVRNVHMQRRNTSHENYDDYVETQSIDYELKHLAKSMPPKWWVEPTLNSSTPDTDIMHNSAVLHAQTQHFYLLVLLHQPYLLKRSYSYPIVSCGVIDQARSFDFTYSKLVALSASREMLSRFLVFRTFHRGPAYRGVDHKGFTSAVTLLLAHLDGHRYDNANALEIHRPQDLGMIFSVMDLFNQDGPRGKKFAETLQRLIEVEADAANGSIYYFVRSETSNDATQNNGLDLEIPYFGTMSVLKSSNTVFRPDRDCLDLSLEYTQDSTPLDNFTSLDSSIQDTIFTMPGMTTSDNLVSTSNLQGINILASPNYSSGFDYTFFSSWVHDDESISTNDCDLRP
ncbi:uncharacterized protein TRUGW13939_10912 [Talaromyces rugulosus]|uniref:Zn(2)-C6 fungal-type domain-containing protein n=1 Tax=Talaromyces rugulosus TaxID=121627 RepID=A0A7H8RDE5_TALRU|nr:uncharacterized protein TRUGW13939_10912 [Talaromyces rugulosus]QKX63741.1 hypothetical protein TRUGW13939_10912 [Talaromyces rugulosus]